MKNLLLICYDFPPNAGIGGRRWAKHAKVLAQLGHHVHVIKAESVDGRHTSAWTQDVAHQNIHVHTLPRTYPKAISHPNKGLKASLLYRWHSYQLQKKVEGTIYDLAIGWDKFLLKKASDIISNQQITHILATGAPFNVLYYGAKIKEAHPNLFYLADFRDPWLTAKNYGMSSLSPKRMDAEIKKQMRVFDWADCLTCTNENMRLEILNSLPTHPPKGKFEVVPHAYDLDDYELNNSFDSESTNPQNIKLVYGGALYLGLEPYIRSWVQALKELQRTNPNLYTRLDIQIYTPDLQYAHYFEPVHDVVKVAAPIGKKIFSELAKANGILMFLADHNKDNFTTKFAESLPFKKPIIYLGAQGKARQFIIENELGLDALEVDWIQLLADFPKWVSTPNKEALVSKHALPAIGDQLNKLLA